jgi:hypothetical protein
MNMPPLPLFAGAVDIVAPIAMSGATAAIEDKRAFLINFPPFS